LKASSAVYFFVDITFLILSLNLVGLFGVVIISFKVLASSGRFSIDADLDAIIKIK
jgi:hypothetical protein